jgi:dTDP-4-dehydrorhamnose reductase
MKVLVIGYQGMLARELRPCLTHAGCTVVGQGRPDVGITQAPNKRRTVPDVQPDILIQAAAYMGVDQAESEPDVVFAVGWDVPGRVAAAHRAVLASCPVHGGKAYTTSCRSFTHAYL